MTADLEVATIESTIAPSRAARRRRKVGRTFGFAVLAVLAVAALIPEALLPHNPRDGRTGPRLAGPVGSAKYVSGYLLGTDPSGRDILSMLMSGARTTLGIALSAAAIGLVVGVLAGLYAGYKSNWLSSVIMRIVDVQLAFPALVLLIAVVAAIGPSVPNLVFVLGVSTWAPYARLVFGEVRVIRGQGFVEAAELLKFSTARILLRHLLPHVLPSILVFLTIEISHLILAESALSYLGLGVQAPTPSWGTMVADGKEYLGTSAWLSLAPGLMISITVLAFNLIGDSYRDALDRG